MKIEGAEQENWEQVVGNYDFAYNLANGKNNLTADIFKINLASFEARLYRLFR